MEETCSLPQPKIIRHQRFIACSKIIRGTFQNSLLTGVPKINNEKSGLFKSIRIVIMIICITGFFHQMLQFFRYHAYQVNAIATVTDVGNVVLPAFTVCARSPGSRKKYCGANPLKCKPNDGEKFCLFNPNFCENGSSVSFPQAYGEREYLNAFTPPEIFSEENETLVAAHYAYYKLPDYLPCSSPYLYGYDGEKTENISSAFISPHYEVGTAFYVSYDLKDILKPTYPTVVILGVHSPFDTQFSEIELALGKKYEVQIRMEQHRLLPSPYTTDCRDYIHEFTSNKFTGPWSKQICLQFCNVQPYLDDCGCVPLKQLKRGKIFPFDLLCQTDEEYACATNASLNAKKIDECYTSCKNDCVKWIYHTDVLERMQTYVEDPAITGVVFRLKEMPLTVLSYKPKYEIVEIVGYVGAYLAFWLGFCMISLADFLLSVFKTLLELFCKRSSTS